MYNKLKALITEEKFKFVSIITTFYMLAAHGYIYLNTIFSHDSMKIIYWGDSLFYDSVEIGRYIIPLYLLIRGKYYPPLLVGMLSIIFMILLIYILILLFDIKNKINIAIISGVISTSCTITLLNATYIEYSDMYILSFLLATISLYILLKAKIKFKTIISIVLFVISMGIYQTAFPIFLTLLFIYTIIEILKKNDVKACFKNLCKNTIICSIASVIYFIIYRLVLLVLKIKPSTCYNSVNKVAKFNSIKDMYITFKNQYKITFQFIQHPSTYYSHIVFVINICLIIITIYTLYKIIKTNKYKLFSKLLTIALLVSLTFIVNCTFFLANGVIHELMILPMFLLYLLLIVIFDRSIEQKDKVFKHNYFLAKRLYSFLIISFCIMFFSAIIYSNQIYLKKNMEFDATKMTMNRIVQNIENMDEYDVEKTPIVFIGYLNNGPLAYEKPELDYKAVGQGAMYGLTYYRTYKQFLNYYMGYPVEVLDEETSLKYAEKVKNMKPFPSKESYRIIDGVLVIKLS